MAILTAWLKCGTVGGQQNNVRRKEVLCWPAWVKAIVELWFQPAQGWLGLKGTGWITLFCLFPDREGCSSFTPYKEEGSSTLKPGCSLSPLCILAASALGRGAVLTSSSCKGLNSSPYPILPHSPLSCPVGKACLTRSSILRWRKACATPPWGLEVLHCLAKPSTVVSARRAIDLATPPNCVASFVATVWSASLAAEMTPQTITQTFILFSIST